MGLPGLSSGLTLLDGTFATSFATLLLLTRLIGGFVAARFLAQYFRFISVSELTACEETIIGLAPRLLTLYLESRGQMLELNCRRGLVDLLTAAPTAPNKSFLKI